MASGFHGGGEREDRRGRDERNPHGVHVRSPGGRRPRSGVLVGALRRSVPGLDASVICRPICTSGFRKSGGKCCALLRPFYQKMDREHSCGFLYRKGAEMAVEVAFPHPVLFPSARCPGPSKGWLRRTVRAQVRDDFKTARGFPADRFSLLVTVARSCKRTIEERATSN